MKNFRFLIPVFSFGLILTFALAAQYGRGGESFISITELHATSSKNFSTIATHVHMKFGQFSFVLEKPLFQILVLFAFFAVCVSICLYVFVKRKHKAPLGSDEESSEEK